MEVLPQGIRGRHESQLVSWRCKPFVEWGRNARLVNVTKTKSNNGNLRGTECLHAYSRRGGLGRHRENCFPECGGSRDCELVHHSRPEKEDAGGCYRMKERTQGGT